jgi:hypothetical protein
MPSFLKKSKKWNWGAFLLNGIWGLGNETYIALLSFAPYLGYSLIWGGISGENFIVLFSFIAGFVMPFILGAKGNEWAWRNKRWESVEHFQRVQQKWTEWGIRVVLALVAFGIVLAVAAGIAGY